jgi:hypothetical protein
MKKFAIRKSRKLATYGTESLVLPLLEFGYFFQSIPRAPLEILLGKLIPVVQLRKSQIEARAADGKGSQAESIKSGKNNKKSANASGSGSLADVYWDDWCLVRFLEGVCWRYVAYPVRSFYIFVIETNTFAGL